MNMNKSEQQTLRDAEAQFREAVQREQSELMAVGVGRAEATEILLGRLRRSTHHHDSQNENACVSPVAAPPPGFSAEELEALMKSYGYSREDALRALTICHEIRRLEATGIGGVAAARELTQRVLDRRDVVGGCESAGGARAGAGGGVVGTSGSGGVAETGGGIVSGGVGAEVDTGFKHVPKSPKHSRGCGEGIIKSEDGVGQPSSHRCNNNRTHIPSQHAQSSNTNSATSLFKSRLVNECDKPSSKPQRPGDGGGLGSGPTACRSTTASPQSSGRGGGAVAGVDGNGGTAGGTANAAWEVRLAGRKRQCASTVNEPMRSCSGMANGFSTCGGGRGRDGGEISSGAGAPDARGHGGDQGVFPAPSPSRAVSGGCILPLTQEQQQLNNGGLNSVVPSVMSIDDLAPGASERAPRISREPILMMGASGGVVGGVPFSATVSSSEATALRPTMASELLQTRDPISISSSLSRNSERTDASGIGNRVGGRRSSSSSSGTGVGMHQWSMANRHAGGNSGDDRNGRVVGRPEEKHDGHNDDTGDMMDVTASSPPLISPAAKRYRYQNGHHHSLTSGLSSSPGRVPPALCGVPPAGATGGLGFHHEYHRMQAQHQQQQEQIQRGGLGGRREGTREAHPLVFVHEQGSQRQEEQEQQLQLAFHELGVRQRNATPSPSMLTSVQPKRPRGPDEDAPHGKRPRSG